MIAALLWEGQETGGGRFGDKESRSGTLDDFFKLGLPEHTEHLQSCFPSQHKLPEPPGSLELLRINS